MSQGPRAGCVALGGGYPTGQCRTPGKASSEPDIWACCCHRPSGFKPHRNPGATPGLGRSLACKTGLWMSNTSCTPAQHPSAAGEPQRATARPAPALDGSVLSPAPWSEPSAIRTTVGGVSAGSRCTLSTPAPPAPLKAATAVPPPPPGALPLWGLPSSLSFYGSLPLSPISVSSPSTKY